MPEQRPTKVTHIGTHRAYKAADEALSSDNPLETESLPINPRIAQRREELQAQKRAKEERRRKNRSVIGSLAVATVAAVITVAVMHNNSRPASEVDGNIPVTIREDESVSEAVERGIETANPGEQADMSDIYSQTQRIVERDLHGNSTVHEGDTIHVDVDG